MLAVSLAPVLVLAASLFAVLVEGRDMLLGINLPAAPKNDLFFSDFDMMDPSGAWDSCD